MRPLTRPVARASIFGPCAIVGVSTAFHLTTRAMWVGEEVLRRFWKLRTSPGTRFDDRALMATAFSPTDRDLRRVGSACDEWIGGGADMVVTPGR